MRAKRHLEIRGEHIVRFTVTWLMQSARRSGFMCTLFGVVIIYVNSHQIRHPRDYVSVTIRYTCRHCQIAVKLQFNRKFRHIETYLLNYRGIAASAWQYKSSIMIFVLEVVEERTRDQQRIKPSLLVKREMDENTAQISPATDYPTVKRIG